MRQERVKVEGMTCQHCVQIITDALKNITGLNTVNVDLVKKEVMWSLMRIKPHYRKYPIRSLKWGSNYPLIKRNS